MDIPQNNFNPPFRFTRTSHIVLTARDLAASKSFYTEVIGLTVTEETSDTLYFRGVEEACHHSLVVRKSITPECLRIGFRVMTEEDLDGAYRYFRDQGRPAEFVEVPRQGRTLHVSDLYGTPLEICAQMPAVPRMITQFHSHKGGRALRIDHFQVLTPDVRASCEFYMKAGFRLSEFICKDGEFDPIAAFLQRKGNPHDLALFNGAGPRMHHFAFMTSETTHLLHACDVAGELGYGLDVERGPGRHGPGLALFVYFRDPDGHRIELFNTHYLVMDLENEPVRWDPSHNNVSFPWGMPARRQWFEEATNFADVGTTPPRIKRVPITLESFLAGGLPKS